MLATKLKVWMLGLLAVLLLGSYTAVPASANPGPFCHHRAIGSEGDDGKISAQTPEQFAGSGGEQKLIGKMAGTEFEITAPAVQVKGIIYNNALQCQAKVELKYQEVKLVKPVVAGCTVTVGTIGENTVRVAGHQAWTYAELAGELTEQPQARQKPDWIFLPAELAEGVKELPKESFTTINFGSKCGVFSLLKIKVNGSVGAESKPEKVGIWSTNETVTSTKGEQKQHFWNGTEYVPVITGLIVGTEGASYIGSFTVKTIGRQQLPAQEIAHFEGP